MALVSGLLCAPTDVLANERPPDPLTEESLVSWLEGLPWDEMPWTAGQQIATYEERIERAGPAVIDRLFKWLAARQEEDGLWGTGNRPWHRVGCTLKLRGVYEYFDYNIPRPDFLYAGLLRILRSGGQADSYALLSDVIRLFITLEEQGQLRREITDVERLEVVKLMIQGMALFRRADGGFCNEIDYSDPFMGTTKEAKLLLGRGGNEGTAYTTYMVWYDRGRLYHFAKRKPPPINLDPFILAVEDPASVKLRGWQMSPLRAQSLDEAFAYLEALLDHDTLVFFGRLYDPMTGGFFAMPSSRSDPFQFQPVLHVTGNVIIALTHPMCMNAAEQLPEWMRLGLLEFQRLRYHPASGLYLDLDPPYGGMRRSDWWVGRTNGYIARAFHSLGDDPARDANAYVWCLGLEAAASGPDEYVCRVHAYDGDAGTKNGAGIDRVELQLFHGDMLIYSGVDTNEPYEWSLLGNALPKGLVRVQARVTSTRQAGNSKREAVREFDLSK